jgi:perosamine synthetase
VKVPYFKPSITLEDKNSINKALNSRWLTNGPILKKFENSFSKYLSTKHSLGVSSATHGLHLCLKSLGISKNDEVIVPSFTFSATADAVRYCDGKVVFADVDLDSFNIQSNQIEKKITKHTKAIIVVHYGGQSCNMKEILGISKKFEIPIIEDCAHALGSKYMNKFCGNFGHAGCFSFYPTKIITTGEGGMITTNYSKLFHKSLKLRAHGMDNNPSDREKNQEWKYDITDLGFNYRLDEIRSAIGLSQFKRISKINDARIEIAKIYESLLEPIDGIITPKQCVDRNHIFHLYTIKITKDFPLTRNQLFKKLMKKGIGTSVQYFPLHMMSYYKKLYKLKPEDLPNCNILKDQVLCLPIYPQLTKKQIKFVVSSIIN